jgi:uncharacterized membrane protein
MSDSNPRRDDWDNTLRGVYVTVALVIIGAFLFLLFVTGHAVAAFWTITALCIGSLIVRALYAHRYERDH